MANWKGIIGRGFRPQDFGDYVGTVNFTDWRPQFVVLHNTSEPKLSQCHSTPGENANPQQAKLPLHLQVTAHNPAGETQRR
jgi:hypothetical protein